MKLSDILSASLNNLRRSKSRAIRTITGVLIGACSIVLMVSLGIGANASTQQMLQEWGDLTLIEVTAKGDDAIALSNLTVKAFLSMDNVLAVTPNDSFSAMDGTLVAGRSERYQSTGLWGIRGMYPETVATFGYTLTSGVPLPTTGNITNKIPILASDLAALEYRDTTLSPANPGAIRNVFDENGQPNPEDPFFDITAEKIILRMFYAYDEEGLPQSKDYELVIVGTFNGLTASGGVQSGYIMSIDNMMYLEDEYNRLNRSASTEPIAKNTNYTTLQVKVNDVTNMDAVEAAIKQLGYEPYSMVAVRDQMQAQIMQGQVLLGSTAAISLLIAALNISNTMTMAISERTKEIGIMKVMGCNTGSIRLLFLSESALIGLVGGVIGALLAVLLSTFINNFSAISDYFGLSIEMSLQTIFGMTGEAEISTPSVIPVWLLIASALFSTTVGLISGLTPANKAVRVTPIEAIRTNT